MSIQYVNSDEVLVFPSTRRSSVQASARYQQESTFINTVVKLADYADGNFIITRPSETDDGTGKLILAYDPDDPFEFMIHGYWFRISQLKNIINNFDSKALEICAYIELDRYIVNSATEEEKIEYKYELIGRDDSDLYTGLKFDSKILEESDTRYVLPLFRRTSSSDNWYTCVISTSLNKYDSQFIELAIDGGIIK